jgi:hypothetical protein
MGKMEIVNWEMYANLNADCHNFPRQNEDAMAELCCKPTKIILGRF